MNTNFPRRCVRAYLSLSRRIWARLPDWLQFARVGRAYGRHLHALVCRHAERKQNHSTFFLRNRSELTLMCRLLEQKAIGSTLDLTVLACSKGAEVYSILWSIRSARPDLKVSTKAVDISLEIVRFAEKGVYSRNGADALKSRNPADGAEIADATWKDQPVSIFERMTDKEVDAMFEVEGDQARVRSGLKRGITWLTGNAADPELIRALGPQEIVVANRFLCHMDRNSAEKCLRNIARLVKPGGYLFVSGVDLDVRTKVARSLGWKPVADLLKEVHEGDVSLKSGWPLDWWGVEPFCHDLPDWKIRYASVFQIGEMA
jgi:chemotaxis methyl-accepting protein methylase